MNKLKYLAILALASTASFGVADIAGVWEGTLEVAPGNNLEVQFTIEQSADGSIDVVLNSPESGAIKNVKANSASFSDNTFKLEVAELSGSYEGKLENNVITGQWKQLDQTIALNLKPFEETVLSDSTVALIKGRWQGVFEPPGQKVNVAITVEESEPGKLRTTFEQLDAGATMVLPDFKIEGNAISFRVGPNGPKYTGTVSGDNISGEIDGGSIKFPGSLTKRAFNPKDYALDLTPETKELLLGQWHGEMTTPVGAVTAVFRFVEEEPNFIRGYFDSPDRGATGIPVNKASIVDGKVEFAMGAGRGFIGTIKDGSLEGEYSQQGQKLPVTLNKGALPALALDLPASANTLIGNWTGKLATPQGELTVGIRFEKTADGQVVGYLDSPDQGMEGARIRFASFEDGALTVRSTLLRMEYSGTLDNNKLTGKMSQGGQNLELNLAKTE
jgi:hypothetical protein